jgi:beta-lactamase regulating signal transducer with metallopeptidase domain
MNTLNPILESFLQALTRHESLALLVTAIAATAALAGAAEAMTWMLRERSARARVVLWRLTVVGLLTLGVWRLMPDVSPSAVVMEWEVMVPLESPVDVKKADETSQLLLLPEKTIGDDLVQWSDAHVLSVWLAGAAVWLFWRVLRSLAGMRWLRKNSVEAPAAVLRVLSGLTAGKWPQCRLVRGLSTPMLTGWFKPVIWLPAEAAEWPVTRLRSALRHELAHFERADVPWHWLAQMMVCLWWWQPLAWRSRARLHAETEHAADDHALMAGEDAADYARTLVEIAAGMPPGAVHAGGVPMLGRSSVGNRVRELMKRNLWRGRIGFGALVALGLVSVLIAVVAMTKMEFIPRKPMYESRAKLVAGGRMQAVDEVRWEEMMQDFYGTIIETLESAEMQKKAKERVKALNPEIGVTEVTVHVMQNKGSSIFHLSCVSSDPVYTRRFLDALLDEFMSFRQAIREQAQGKVLSTFLQEVVNKQKAMEEKNDVFSKWCTAHNILTTTNANSESAQFLTSLKAQREALRQELADLQLAQTNVTAAVSSAERDGSGRAMTQAEKDFIQSQSELRRMRNELRYLTQEHNESHPEVVEAKKKVEKAGFLSMELQEALKVEMMAREGAVARKIEVIEGQMAEMEKAAQGAGALMAEHARLKREAEIAQEAYETMFKRAENFQQMFNIQSDYVAIMERATPSEKVVASSLIPVWKLWSGSAEPAAKDAK